MNPRSTRNRTPSTRTHGAPHAVAQRLAGLAALALLAVALSACTQVAPTHVATLQPNGTSGASGSATARIVATNFTVEGTFEDLSGPATGGELFDEVAMQNVFDLAVDAAPSGGFSGNGTLTDEQITRLDNGDLSIRIYTDAYPEGTTVGELEGNLTQN